MYSKIIGSVIMPYLSEDDEVQRRNFFTIYSRVSFLSILVMVAIFALFGDFLIPFIYGAEFEGSVAPFYVLLIGMIFTSMSQLFGTMLFSKGRNDVTLLANSVGLVITVVLDILLIPKYGIVGAAIATTFSYFFLFAVLLFNLLTKEKFRLSQLFVAKKTDFFKLYLTLKKG